MRDQQATCDRRACHGGLPDRGDYIPPMPQALHRLFAVMRDENASLGDLEEIVVYDQALSAKILQIANSAYYNPHGAVCSLFRAIMSLGFHEVKSICLCGLLMKGFPNVP